MSRSKWMLLTIVLAVLLSVADHFRVYYRQIGFEEARALADRRFERLAAMAHLRPTDFVQKKFDDRGDEWLFEWQALKSEGEIGVTVTVGMIIHRNGELSDFIDERPVSDFKR